MRAEDADILIVPGLGGSGPNHWQSRWEGGLKSARRIQQADWDHPDRRAWQIKVRDAVRSARQPVILVAHSLGVLSAVEAAGDAPDAIVGAFLVAPPDVEDPSRVPAEVLGFAPIARKSLPFRSFLIASRTDPYCDFARAEALAQGWGSVLIDAGDAGHVNPDSGHGPWPEGLLLFSRLLRQISQAGEKL